MRRSIQLLIARKAADATALTAREAIQTLLGYGDVLVELYRRQLLELELRGDELEPLSAAVEAYLERTVTFWNPNRERCWVRIAGPGRRAWEGGRGMAARPCGEPDLERPDLDHLLVWSRDPAAAPPDLPRSLGGARWTRVAQGDLYSFAWGGESDESKRVRLLEGVAVAQSRGRGLLVQPHYQDHRLILGPVPIPVWEPANHELH